MPIICAGLFATAFLNIFLKIFAWMIMHLIQVGGYTTYPVLDFVLVICKSCLHAVSIDEFKAFSPGISVYTVLQSV